MSPPGAASFLVLTPTQAPRWAQGERLEPVGQGTPDQAVEGGLVWNGSLNEAGVYSIVVHQTGLYGGTFVLTVSGTSVSPAGVSP